MEIVLHYILCITFSSYTVRESGLVVCFSSSKADKPINQQNPVIFLYVCFLANTGMFRTSNWRQIYRYQSNVALCWTDSVGINTFHSKLFTFVSF